MNNFKLGDLVTEKYDNPSCFGIVTKVSNDYYHIHWFKHPYSMTKDNHRYNIYGFNDNFKRVSK
ncbi:MAG: hypothetical protein Q8P81_03640 [Nanoarchaeota archaeon]|nr:hypothetical protein [Nanoarchaeota archaeon]